MPLPLKVADGGYCSWAYGCDIRFEQSFSTALLMEYVVAMDTGNLLRTRAYPEYKAQRQERRDNDPSKAERYQRVQLFQRRLWDDHNLRTWSYNGLEADDLIGLIAWWTGGIDLLGVDKDLFQLGNRIHTMRRIGGEVVTIEAYFKKLPKGIQDVQRTPENVLFLLTLMGDKSDNIERLVPPYTISIFHELLHSKDKWNDAYFRYGERFLHNLYMVTVPFPGLFGIQPLELLHLVSEDRWHPSPELWGRLELFNSKLYRELKENARPTE